MLSGLLGLPNEPTRALDAVLLAAPARLDLEASARIHRVTDVGTMIAGGVRQPPALRIDGHAVCRRRVPDVGEVVRHLRAAQEATRAAEA